MQDGHAYGSTDERDQIGGRSKTAQQLQQVLARISASERLADRRRSAEDECIESDLKVRLNHFCRQLSPTLRKAFQLRDVEGLSVRETARILGVPPGTVKAQSSRARKRLKELMSRAFGPKSRRPIGMSYADRT